MLFRSSHAEHGHDHDHDHSHTPTITSDNERKVLLSFGLIFTFMVVEVVGGLLSGSLALLADAGHMMTDAAALALAYAAFRFGQRAADSKRTFGYLRFEVVAGFVNAVTLFAIVGWIVYEAWERFQEPQPILAGPMFGVAVAGLLVNILVFWILTRGDSEHVNIKGAALHVLGDLLGSVGAVGAAIVIYLTGWTPIDPILSVLVSLLVLRSAWKLAARSLHILLEGAPDGAAPEKIERHLLEHVRAWLRLAISMCGRSRRAARWRRCTSGPRTTPRPAWSCAQSSASWRAISRSSTPPWLSTGTRKARRAVWRPAAG